jgi:hypothetical protein
MADASMRVSDDDREQAVLALREHLLAGRLTLEEFSRRAEAALRARAVGELALVREDLPDIFVPAVGVPAVGSQRRPARVTTALFGHVVRRGRLRLRRRAVIASGFGNLDFDLREVTIDGWRTTVTVLAAFGNVDVYVPEGINVEVDGVTVFGHLRDWGRDTGRPEAPSIHVRVLGWAGTIDVWRVPPDLREATYTDIIRQLHPRRRPPAVLPSVRPSCGVACRRR